MKGLIEFLGVGPFVAFVVFTGLGVLGMLWPCEVGLSVDMSRALAGPSLSNVLGTDWLGRDLLSRTVCGTRGFFGPGFAAVGVATVVGVSLGALAGYAPTADGRIRAGLRGLLTLALAIPGVLPRFVSIVLFCAAWGSFEPYLIAGVAGLLYAAELGEDVRQRVGHCSREEYVEAARADGVTSSRILGYHLLWLQCRWLVLRHLVHLWAFVILVETSLGFMPGQFGIQEPNPSWGNMLEGASGAVLSGDPWPAIVPTVAIVSTVVMLTWMGDRLREPEEVVA